MFTEFLRRTERGEYCCHDGEVGSLTGAIAEETERIRTLLSGNGEEQSSVKVEYPCSGPYEVDLPEVPDVEFGLSRSLIAGMQPSREAFPRLVMDVEEKSADVRGRFAMKMLAETERRALEQNLLTEPVFAVAAWQLEDGSFVRPTPPVLLVANSEAPLVAGGANNESSEVEFSAVMAVCRLQAKIVSTDWPENARLALFLSAPISLYDRKGSFTGWHRVAHRGWSHSAKGNGDCREHQLTEETFAEAWRPSACDSDEIMRSVSEAVRFRQVASISERQATDYQTFRDVDFNCGGLRHSVSQGEEYVPDYVSHCGIAASGSGVISGRHTLWDLTLTAPDPGRGRQYYARTEGGVSGGGGGCVIEARLMKNGIPVTAMRRTTTDGGPEISEGSFPRYLFYPDPDCRELRIASGDKVYVVPMVRHPFLYGSWHWCGSLSNDTLMSMGVESHSGTVSTAGESVVCGTWREPWSIRRSERGNGKVWPGNVVMTTDVGRVVCLARAFRSSGLVGTTSATLYLFSEDGIYLLKEGSDGILRDAGMISAYGIGDANAVRYEGLRICFTSMAGEMLTIEGTKVKEASSTGSEISTGRRIKIRGDGDRLILTTRTYKFGDGERRKRVFSLMLRGSGCGRLSVTLSGGNRPDSLYPMARGEGGIKGLRAPGQRFYQLRIEGNLSGEIEGVAWRIGE